MACPNPAYGRCREGMCCGGGYACSVSKEGWKGFYEHLGNDFAIDCFSDLWDWNTSEAKKKRVLAATKDPQGRHKVLLSVRNGLTSVSIDGELALDASDHLKDHFVLPRPDSHMTIRGQLLDIHGIRYRRIAPKVE